MKKITTKKIFHFLPLAAAGSLIAPAAVAASCGDSSSKTNPEGELTIAVWKGNDIEEAAKNAVLSGFKAKYPSISARFITYTDRVQDISKFVTSGDIPDILLLDSGDFAQMAKAETIKPIDPTKFTTNQQLSGLMATVFAPMVGKITNGNYASATAAELGNGTSQVSELTGINFSTSIPAGYNVYGVPKDFSTLAAYFNNGHLASGVNLPSSFKTYQEFLTYITDAANLSAPTKGSQKGAVGLLGVQPELAREIGLLETTFYNKYKDASKDVLLAAITNGAFRTDLLAATNNSKNLFDLRKNGKAVAQVEHQYGWNGEAFDNDAASTVVEGNWFTPSNKAKTSIVAIGGSSGLYYSGWSLSATLNDSDAAYKFLDYVTYGEGAITGAWNNGTLGLETPFKDNLEKMVAAAKAVPAGDSKAFVAKSFLEHTKSIVGSTPNRFTLENIAVSKAWEETFKTTPAKSDTFESKIDSFISNLKSLLQSAS